MQWSRLFNSVILVLVIAPPAMAQHQLPYRVSIDGSYTNRYLDDQKIGTIGSQGVQYYLDANHDRVLAMEYYTNQNDIPESFGVELAEESFDFGVYAPVSPVKIKMAGSVNRYLLGDDYWALGIYPQLKRGRSSLDVSVERDADAAVFTSGRLSTSVQAWSGSFGLSNEQIRGRDPAQRFGIEVTRRFDDAGLMTIAGATVNPDDAPTWIAGLAHPASTSSVSGANPGLLAIVRQKPESLYRMALITLWGKTLSAGTCTGIGESIFNGSLSRSRVVRNRDFNTIGVGGGYDLMDFGLVAGSVSHVNVDVGAGAHVRSSNVSLYGTLPRRVSFLGVPIDNPFLGVESQTITDLTFNPQTNTLEDFKQGWRSLSFGCKFQVDANAKASPEKQAGYLRLRTVLRFDKRFDGAYLSATLWH